MNLGFITTTTKTFNQHRQARHWSSLKHRKRHPTALPIPLQMSFQKVPHTSQMLYQMLALPYSTKKKQLRTQAMMNMTQILPLLLSKHQLYLPLQLMLQAQSTVPVSTPLAQKFRMISLEGRQPPRLSK